jgi:hypothetical protein
MYRLSAIIIAVGLSAFSATAAQAQSSIPYPCCGYNPVTYTFTAASSGDIVAYFADNNTASYNNELGLLVNGTEQGGFGLDNQTSTLGQSYDFGYVTAGASLVFVLNNLSLGKEAYSDPSMNTAYDSGPATGTTDGHNHIYSTEYDGTNPGSDTALLNAAGVPYGTYVAFEDLPFPGSDYNYHDEVFVFTNVSLTSSVPEPATWAMFLLGFGGIGFMMRNSRRKGSVATA